MLGSELFDELAQSMSDKPGGKKLSNMALSRSLGISLKELKELESREITARDVSRIVTRRSQVAEGAICDSAIKPIVEFFELEYEWTTQGASARLFPLKDENGKPYPYLVALCDRLKEAKGIYVFHDSRGRAIYAGKAVQQSLWAEMTSAYNRRRGEVQSIKRADHPRIKGKFGATAVQIKRREICL